MYSIGLKHVCQTPKGPIRPTGWLYSKVINYPEFSIECIVKPFVIIPALVYRSESIKMFLDFNKKSANEDFVHFHCALGIVMTTDVPVILK